SDVYTAKTKTTTPASAPTAFEMPKDYLMGSDHYYAQMVLKRFGQDIRWCGDMERFFVWNNGHWKMSKDQKVFQKLNDLVKELKDDIFLAKDADFKDLKKLIDRATKFASIHRQRAVLDYIKRDLMIESAELDKDVYLLNFQNCTVDLKTGEQKPHDRSDYITQMIPHDYEPEAKSELWTKFVDEIMGHDAEMVEYLQLAMGYACNGSTDEQSLFMLYGMGANGKSTFCEAILDALGDYGKTVADDFFVAKHQREHPTEIADLQGARLVVGSEFGGVMDEGKVKRLTGSDKLKARFMRGDMFEFAPTQTYFVCVNNKPTIRNTDDGIWRRVKLIPFTQQFSGDRRDKHLPKKLKLEHQGILAWLVDGAVRSYCKGIVEPEAVTIASKEYREEFDLIGRFIDDCCDTSNPHSKIKSSRLYQAYEKWAETIGEFKHGNKQFSTELLRKNFEKTKNGCMFWHGISLSESYQRWDLEGLEGKKHKLQENDSYVECNSASVPSRMSKNEDLTPPPVTTNTSKNQLSEEAKEPTAPPAQDDKPQTASTAEVEEKVDTGGGDASEPHIQDLKPDQLGVEVRMSDFIKRPPCLNIEAFEELDSEERIDVLIQQCCSLGFYRHEIGFESLYQGLKDDYLSRTHTNLINEFTMNLEQLAVNGSYNGNGNHNGNGDQR
ncbi:MAG: phage/plasmid primase, P4 family, partial [Candidatus Poribacteria bacterium]|nr:phage/plasmid primase, P4 family [Candidatus Poribacteria bacterium]